MKRHLIQFISILGFFSYYAGVYSVELPVVDAGLVTIKSPAQINPMQKLPHFVGISAKSAGAKEISMNLVIIPPGAEEKPHYHNSYESVVYLIQGKVETRYGPGLEKSVIHVAGDFIFIPPGVPHAPRNLSDTEPAIAIVSRNDANENENTIPYAQGDQDINITR